MFVVATAGHVDHGKSTLVRALTGMEPDRWAEERRRGMTIDLGFAWTVLPGGETVAFVDVPGHERFVGNMLAGVGPVPAVLFVVAADEGWMPQSAEHLDVLHALGVHYGLLAVTRSDRADPGPALAQALAELEASSLGTAGSPGAVRTSGAPTAAGAPGPVRTATAAGGAGPVRAGGAGDGGGPASSADTPGATGAGAGVEAVVVSGATGAGLEELRAALGRLVRRLPAPDPAAPVRLWVDRAFTIRGSGTVVTGTLPAGQIRVGDELWLVPGSRPVTVRAVQSMGESRAEVAGTARVAVNLRGVRVAEVGRGDALVSAARWLETDEVDARLTLPRRSGGGWPAAAGFAAAPAAASAGGPATWPAAAGLVAGLGAELAGAELADGGLAGAELGGGGLAGAELAGAELAGVELGGGGLAGAELAGGGLGGGGLAGAELAGGGLAAAGPGGGGWPGRGARGLPRAVTLHIGSAAVQVHVRPLGTDTVRLRLRRRLPLRIGDRALLRDPGRRQVVAGIVVLDVRPPALARRGAAAARAADLSTMDGVPDGAGELRRRGVLRLAELRAMGAEPAARPVTGDWLVDPQRWAAWRQALADLVEAHAASRPLEHGVPVEAARQRLGLPDPRLVTALATGPLAIRDGRVVPAGAVPTVPEPVRAAVDTVRGELAAAPFAAPDAHRLAELGLGPQELAAAVRAGAILRVGDGVYLLPGAELAATQALRGLPQPFTLSQARQALGTTRRVAVPLLELLDARGLTERLPDSRRRLREPT